MMQDKGCHGQQCSRGQAMTVLSSHNSFTACTAAFPM